MQCVTMCCSVLRVAAYASRVAVCSSEWQYVVMYVLNPRTACGAVCSVYMPNVAVCCRVLQCVPACCSVCAQPVKSVVCRELQCVAVCCSVLQCVAVCCIVLQCVAVCCRHADV